MINVDELNALIAKFKDTARLKKATENSLYNASNVVKDGVIGDNNHIFKNQTPFLEKAVFVEVKGLSSDIFTPLEGVGGVPYAGWIWEGKRRTKTGKTATWNNGKGDPYIENSYIKNESKFFKTMQEDLTQEIQDFL